MDINRPLDLLNELKGKKVIVNLKNKTITGELLAFDIHINLVLDNAKEIFLDNKKRKINELGLTFFRGDDVVSVSGGV